MAILIKVSINWEIWLTWAIFFTKEKNYGKNFINAIFMSQGFSVSILSYKVRRIILVIVHKYCIWSSLLTYALPLWLMEHGICCTRSVWIYLYMQWLDWIGTKVLLQILHPAFQFELEISIWVPHKSSNVSMLSSQNRQESKFKYRLFISNSAFLCKT